MSTRKSKPKTDDNSIESTMKSIELLLEKLENSETPLEQSLEAFEQGINLVRSAQKTLAEAEQKVQVLLESADGPEAQAFDRDDEGDF